MLFYPTGILHFHFFGCHFGPRLLSLWQKCDPDRRDQNSHKSRLCFFTQQTFLFSFLWLSLGDPTLILVAKAWSWQARQKSHKSRLCFFAQQTFSIFFPLAVIWSRNLGHCEKSVILASAIKIYIQVVYVYFYPADVFHFHSFGCRMGSQLRSLLQKCDPDKCDQN